jgi:hypothetical protein
MGDVASRGIRGQWAGFLFLAAALWSLPSAGEEPPVPDRESLRERAALAEAAEDPTSPLAFLQLGDRYSSGLRGVGAERETANAVVAQVSMPFRTGPLFHVARAVVPFTTRHPVLAKGITDVALFDLVLHRAEWGRFGLGPALLVPTGGADGGAEKWALGPAAAATTQTGPVLWGFFTQHWFSVAGDDDRPDVDLSIVQPIASVALGRGWFASPSSMRFTWDWERDRWDRLPLGARLARIVPIGEAAIQLSVEYEYDFADRGLAPRHTVGVAMKLLFPKRTLRVLGLETP